MSRLYPLALLILALAAPIAAQEATITDVTVIRVVDGDTWDVRASLPIGITFDARLRPLGLDCAEVRGESREMGLEQTAALEDLLFSAADHRLELHGTDAFGRWLVRAWADSIEVTPYMIGRGCEPYR